MRQDVPFAMSVPNAAPRIPRGGIKEGIPKMRTILSPILKRCERKCTLNIFLESPSAEKKPQSVPSREKRKFPKNNRFGTNKSPLIATWNGRNILLFMA